MESPADQSPRRSSRRAAVRGVAALCLSGDDEAPHTHQTARGHLDRRRDHPRRATLSSSRSPRRDRPDRSPSPRETDPFDWRPLSQSPRHQRVDQREQKKTAVLASSMVRDFHSLAEVHVALGDRVESIGDRQTTDISSFDRTATALAPTPSTLRRRSRNGDESHRLSPDEVSRLELGNMLPPANRRLRPPSSRGSRDNSFNEGSGHNVLSFSDGRRSASGTSICSMPHSLLSSLGSNQGSRSNLFETPPCHPDAFEQHATLVECPAPVRATARPTCSRPMMPVHFSLDF